MKNNYLYQGPYSELDEDIGWNDFALRNYDPQIGKWVQQDPFQEYASPYVGIGADPVNLVDPSGGFTLGGLGKAGTAAVLTLGGAIIGTAIGLISGDDDFTGTLIGIGAGLGAGLANLSGRIAANLGIKSANVANTVLNSPNCSVPVGSVNDQVEKTLRNGNVNNRVNQILKDVLKLRTIKEGWDKSHEDPSHPREFNFDVTEDDNCYYSENLHFGDDEKVKAYYKSNAGKRVFGNVHDHTKGSTSVPSYSDIDEFLSYLMRNPPKFGNFILVLGDEEYFALVVTDPVKANKFISDHPINELYDHIRDKNFGTDIKNPENKKHVRKKAIKAIKKFIRRAGRNGFKLFQAKDIKNPNFKPK